MLADEPRDEGRWSDEFAEGAWYGEFREIDTVPQLLGAVSGGASSTVPYAGWITGTLADSRDIVANAVHGRWGDAGASGMGLVPYVGDTAKAAKVVSNFARAKPALVRTVVKSIATWDKMRQDAQMALLGATDKASIETLVDHKLSDGQIVKLAKRGALLATVASNLDRHGEQVIAGISAAFADDDGFVLSLEAAEEALRAEASAEGEAAAKAVYVGQMPAQFRGGRYFSACTRCDEEAHAWCLHPARGKARHPALQCHGQRPGRQRRVPGEARVHDRVALLCWTNRRGRRRRIDGGLGRGRDHIPVAPASIELHASPRAASDHRPVISFPTELHHRVRHSLVAACTQCGVQIGDRNMDRGSERLDVAGDSFRHPGQPGELGGGGDVDR